MSACSESLSYQLIRVPSFQLFEYFYLFNFFRPSALGHTSEAQFDREYVKPIALGMASNCSLDAHYTSLTKSKELNTILDPYVHRVDSSELRKDLPPMQQVVMHVRQTSLQSKLYRAYKRFQRNPHTNVNYNSFLKQYSSLRPVHNHPVRLFVILFKSYENITLNLKFPAPCFLCVTLFSGKSFVCAAYRCFRGTKKANRC